MTMNAEQKTAWLEALRSGEYTQGAGALVMTSEAGITRHCCLGVLCELADNDGVALFVSETEDGMRAYNGTSGDLPELVCEWAGMSSAPNPYVIYDGVRITLAELNDGCHFKDGRYVKLSFNEIADIIEEQL